MLVSPKTWFVAALVALSACGTTPGGAALCATGTHCVADTDCASGSRCNTALSPPACQPLYCGTSGSACSQGYFCESQNCVKQACLSTTAGTPLGNVVPTTITYSRTKHTFDPNVTFSHTPDPTEHETHHGFDNGSFIAKILQKMSSLNRVFAQFL